MPQVQNRAPYVSNDLIMVESRVMWRGYSKVLQSVAYNFLQISPEQDDSLMLDALHALQLGARPLSYGRKYLRRQKASLTEIPKQ